jgi:hypothetical protein
VRKIRTVRIWYSHIYCSVLAVQQHETKEKGAFNDPYRSYGRRTAATNSGHVFQENRTAFNAVTVRTVRLSVHRFRGGCVGFLPVNFKHGNRGKR